MNLSALFNLPGKSALLSGSSGLLIGEMAKALRGLNVRVVPFDFDGGHDVTQKEDWQAVLQSQGPFDILINGAGTNASTPFLDITEGEWDHIIDVHLKGTMFGCQVIGADMVKRGKGSIINMSSASSGPPLSRAFTYSSAKAGVKNLTQNLAREWAPNGVRVNALQPGFFPSPEMREKFLTEERIADIMRHTPMGRFGEPSELIGAVVWLASDGVEIRNWSLNSRGWRVFRDDNLMRTVVVTGGTQGIGRAIVGAFTRQKDRVVIASRSEKVDVTDVPRLTEWADTLGPIDVWINNAGRSAWSPLEKITEDFWLEMIDVNLKAVLFGSQIAAERMKPGGSIINISSLAGKRGSANNAVYCAAKFGVDGITQSLAKELGPQGIRVNAICPVLVDTPGLRQALRSEYAPDEDMIRAQSALGRFPTVHEVASFCVFLASENASAITGQCINIDCGVFPS